MNKEDIIRMAREAGGLPDPMVFIGAYERFAALVAAHEREACAQLCENLEMRPDQGDCWDIGTIDCADAIREAQQRPQNCGTGYCSCIECLFEQPAQPSKPLPEDYTAMEQALTRLQKRYAELEGKASKPWVGLTDEEFRWIYDNGRTPAGMIEMAESKLREKNA